MAEKQPELAKLNERCDQLAELCKDEDSKHIKEQVTDVCSQWNDVSDDVGKRQKQLEDAGSSVTGVLDPLEEAMAWMKAAEEEMKNEEGKALPCDEAQLNEAIEKEKVRAATVIMIIMINMRKDKNNYGKYEKC